MCGCLSVCIVSVLVCSHCLCCSCFFFQAEDGIRDLVRSRGLGDVYKRQVVDVLTGAPIENISVMLYDDFRDSVLRKERPYYLSLIHI